MVLRRLRGRSASELIDRARQRAWGFFERHGLGDHGEPNSRRLFLEDPGNAPAIRGPFFAAFDDREATLEALRALDPGFEGALRARGDRVLAGLYDLLGHRDLTFGSPVDWWRDPIADVRAPDRHWTQIDFLDPRQVGDHKLVWELGRHNALVTLGQAWWCTRDRRYADACLALLEGWLTANPPKRGVHWASSLELSFRSIAWLWVLAFVDDVISPELRRRVIGHLAVAGRHIERHLSTWFSPNTHLTGEALGLFALGTALPQCRDAARWQRSGAAILLEWVDRHVRADGTYVEQSTWYHRYTTDFYLTFLVLGERAGMNLRGRLERPLGGLLDYLLWLTRPDGTMPLIGDDDGGRLLFLDQRTAHDTRTPLAIGAALLNRPELSCAGSPGAELVWLLGPDGWRTFRGLEPRPPATRSRAFPEGGTYVMRSGWDERASVMIIDAGPHGFLNGGHAHADALSLDFTVNGRPVFVDPGTYTYTTSASWRDAFRETASHSAATVDGCSSATVQGPFQWESRAESRCEQWSAEGDVVLFAGSHNGFERLRPPVRYRRFVAHIPVGIWIVRDEIEGDGDHELAVHWQCAAHVSCSGGAGTLTLFSEASPLLEMHVAEAATWRFSDGWISPTYGSKVPARRITCSRRGTGNVAITTAFCEVGLSPRVWNESRDGMPALGVRWRDGEGLLFFAGRSDHGSSMTWLGPDATHQPKA